MGFPFSILVPIPGLAIVLFILSGALCPGLWLGWSFGLRLGVNLGPRVMLRLIHGRLRHMDLRRMVLTAHMRLLGHLMIDGNRIVHRY